MPPKSRGIFLPGMNDPEPGPWTVHETVLDKAYVNKRDKIAEVPPPYTEAQRLSRLHETMHVKISPADFGIVRERVLNRALRNGLDLDPRALLVILKMLEENRVDYVLWAKYGQDIRPAREALDWSKMNIPDDHRDPEHVLEALQWVLQLAWTVWASKGFPGGKVANPPPPRDCDVETEKLFTACWIVVQRHDLELAKAVIAGCLLMYNEPTPRMRDRAAYELATFFPVPPPPPPPEEKEEEQAEQSAAEELVLLMEQAREKDESGGDDNDTQKLGHFEIHDHTRGPRRPTTKIRRRYSATDFGTVLKFPHRYLLDKQVFGRRNQTEGSLMIDFSGSMKWQDEDMRAVLNKMPNIWIASYSGVTLASGLRSIIGRVCIHAKKGRFNVFTGKEAVNDGSNVIDLEALYGLARMPEPRFWLSDGCVTGGKLYGLQAELSELSGLSIRGTELNMVTALVKEVNYIMRKAHILRVPDKDTMLNMIRGRRVTLYRSTYMTNACEDKKWWAPGIDLPVSPVSFQL